MSNVESQQDSNIEGFRKTLGELVPQLNTKINKLNEEVTNPIFLSGDAHMYDVLKSLDDLEVRFKEVETLAGKYN